MTTMLKRAVVLSLVLCVIATGLSACSPKTPDETQTTASTTTTTVATTTTMKKAVLEADNLSVRGGPGFDEEVIGGIFKGDELEIIDREGDWYKIHFGEGEGYVNAQYVDVEDAPNASEMQASCPTTKATTTKASKPTKKGETTKKGQTTTTTVRTTKAGGPTQPPEPTNPDGSGVGNKATKKPTQPTEPTKADVTTKPNTAAGGEPVLTPPPGGEPVATTAPASNATTPADEAPSATSVAPDNGGAAAIPNSSSDDEFN